MRTGVGGEAGGGALGSRSRAHRAASWMDTPPQFFRLPLTLNEGTQEGGRVHALGRA